MDIVGFDFRRDFIERQGAVRRGVDRLRLNAAEHRRTAGFVQIVMRALADDILFAALAVAEQATRLAWVPVGRNSAASLPPALRHSAAVH
jgi:hypothetical protein